MSVPTVCLVAMESEESVGSSGSGVRDDCEPIRGGSETWVLCKST